MDNGVSTFWLQPTVHVTQSDIVLTPSTPRLLLQSRYIKLNVSSAKSHYDRRSSILNVVDNNSIYVSDLCNNINFENNLCRLLKKKY